LDILVQSRRNAVAAKKFFRRLLKGFALSAGQGSSSATRCAATAPGTVVMPSVKHRSSKYLKNRAEHSHQPTRQRERAMKRFTSAGHALRFLSAFSGTRRTSDPASTDSPPVPTAAK
jgi:putative transposase